MIRDREGLTALLDDVRAWVRDVAIPAEDTVEARDEVPEELVDDMRRRGYFGWSIPEQYGGAGLTCEELVLGAMELSQAATAFRARVGTNTGIGSEALVADGTEEQKARYLPALARGEITGCFALTEPEAGSDATALTTSARRDGDHYVLNGTKCYITNAPIAGLFTVMARTDPDNLTAGGISAFLVDAGTPGLSVGPAYKKMGQAGSPVSEVYFEDCRVPAANLIGGVEGQGFATAMKVLNKQRLHLSALCTGPAMRMRDEALAHASKRRQFGRPVAEFQLVQAMIADMQTEIHAARALILETARKRDAGGDVKLDASMCKYFASEMCGRVADRAVQIFGGAGYVADYSCIERLYRDVRLFRLYEGTSQIHQLNIAKLTLRQAS
ncbi:MAG: acyl-CoA dehydrogenase [Alcanivorax sp.]|nr:acyl-CoA dehydrogenase [Alcanivorax sp.]MAY09368.1 acyl-CoA dehydrogenase [Alcanivorax sp.]MBI56155.1 acyl-CoA dehydrogenase [Alcanivorax sp.]HCE38429.1 acyl-CoA dehydrogenase [Alcanivorax sp.]|tara:strand:+ start:42330 stop:43484 length:1155 start_codon:yes stop_codon:yes gene_type:complete